MKIDVGMRMMLPQCAPTGAALGHSTYPRLICHVRLESYEFYNSNFESSLVAKVILYVF